MKPIEFGKLRLLYFVAFILLMAVVFFSFSNYDLSVSREATASKKENQFELCDSHFHLTNYIQEGTDIHDFLNLMGNKVGRVALFGIPLQQQWSYRISGKNPPTYYLETDAPLYYYSFTDANIAMAYKSLTKEQQAKFDPMITGFNPTDMYAAAHIRRVLKTFPGVFSGIGEFTIHKEFVSSKIAGETASLLDPALDSILDFAGEVGLVVIIHNDIDVPFSKEEKEPAYLAQMKRLLKRHPHTTVIWSHLGLGRIIHPVRHTSSEYATMNDKNQIELVSEILSDSAFNHVYFDISWDEVAKYIVRNDTTIHATAALINRYPDRFLFGTDVVAPTTQEQYLNVYYQYDPLWNALNKEAREKVKKGNYIRIFDEARRSVRRWEENVY